MMLNLLTETTDTASTGSSMIVLVIYIVVIGVAMYFFAVRPQKKEQKRMQALINSVEVGDTIVTTSGFYGVVIDITDEDCIVEFGSNKNCRIPMKKSAISEVEKAGDAS
ncbi:MAG: preprotein translocase subunit YajC [Clostridiales bacterium]|nr:preprotein translocase subunit YajC [Clostridiales bacterium]